MMDTEGRVRHDRFGVGENGVYTVHDDLLPTIPEEIRAWCAGDRAPNLYIHGQHGTAKTWLGLWAARDLINEGLAPSLSYWTEQRFAKDRDTLNWFRKVTASDPKADALWNEYSEYESAFYRFANWPLLMVDDVGYWGVGEWQINELWQVLKTRCEADLTSIVVARHLPPSDSPIYSVVRSNFQVVEVRGGE